jgi:hypothetical protein
MLDRRLAVSPFAVSSTSSGRWNKEQPVCRLMLFVWRVKLIRDFLAFFKPTDADASVLLAAYGVHAIDVDQLKNSRLTEQTETDRTSDTLTDRQPIAEPSIPFPIGIHPDITWMPRTAFTPKRCWPHYPDALAALARQSSLQVPESLHSDRYDPANRSDQSKLISSTSTDLSIAFVEMTERSRFALSESSSVEGARIGIAEIIGAVIMVAVALLLIQRLFF